jgi:YidC/Oxa1 family membrane protein insertase
MEIIHTVGSFFNTILHPFILIFINVLLAVNNVLASLHLPYTLGFSIIAVTILIRLATYPLVSKQIRYSKKIQELSPKLSALKKEHKGDQRRFLEEQQKLYKEHGISQAAGCIPTLVQLPVLYGFYIMLSHVVDTKGQLEYINSLVLSPLKIAHPLDPNFFGISLAAHPSSLLSTLPILAISIPVLTGLFQFIQTKMMTPQPVKQYPSDSPKEKKEKESSADMATQMTGQMLIIFPLMIAYASFNFPIGLSLYWNTSTIFGIIQQYKIGGLGGFTNIWQRIRK